MTTLGDVNDDIVSLQLYNIYDGFKLVTCVCYLHPENSSRQVDANTFLTVCLQVCMNIRTLVNYLYAETSIVHVEMTMTL